MDHPKAAPEIADSFSSTGEFRVVELSHLWTIKNFSFHSNDQVITSAPFTSDAGDGIKWHLSLHPQGRKGLAPGEFVSLYLENNIGDRPDVRVKYQLSMVNEKGKTLQTGRGDHPSSLRSRIGYGRFISRGYLSEHRSSYYPNDNLSVLCKITYAIDEAQVAEPKPQTKRQLAEALVPNLLEELFESRTMSNVVFVVQGKEFPVHKAVLRLRSPIFRSLFAQGTGEMTRLEINDMDQADFEDMLRIIYTGVGKACSEMTNKLIAAMMSSLIKGLSTTKDSGMVPTKEPVEKFPRHSEAACPHNHHAILRDPPTSESRRSDRECDVARSPDSQNVAPSQGFVRTAKAPLTRIESSAPMFSIDRRSDRQPIRTRAEAAERLQASSKTAVREPQENRSQPQQQSDQWMILDRVASPVQMDTMQDEQDVTDQSPTDSRLDNRVGEACTATDETENPRAGGASGRLNAYFQQQPNPYRRAGGTSQAIYMDPILPPWYARKRSSTHVCPHPEFSSG